MAKAKRKNRKKGPCLSVKSNSGRKVTAKTVVKTTIGALRRLVGAARKGKIAHIKVRRNAR